MGRVGGGHEDAADNGRQSDAAAPLNAAVLILTEATMLIPRFGMASAEGAGVWWIIGQEDV